MKQLLIAVSWVILTFTLAGCGSSGNDQRAQRAALAAVANGALLVDVRSKDEVKSGMIEGAINIPHTAIVSGLATLNIAKDQPVVVYCRSGNRSGKAAKALEAAGYSQVMNAGAYSSLKATQTALLAENPPNSPNIAPDTTDEGCDKPSCA